MSWPVTARLAAAAIALAASVSGAQAFGLSASSGHCPCAVSTGYTHAVPTTYSPQAYGYVQTGGALYNAPMPSYAAAPVVVQGLGYHATHGRRFGAYAPVRYQRPVYRERVRVVERPIYRERVRIVERPVYRVHRVEPDRPYYPRPVARVSKSHDAMTYREERRFHGPRETRVSHGYRDERVVHGYRDGRRVQAYREDRRGHGDRFDYGPREYRPAYGYR
ncbi:MAG TPA: hypothetical protein VEA41_11315 [Salinarimonas sp.]|nr:hypothetical protein [Salinarimonas sp.]